MADRPVAILAVFLVALNTNPFSLASKANWERCGERLERALDLMQKREFARPSDVETPLETKLPDAIGTFRKRLGSAPIELTVTRVAIKLGSLESASRLDSPWAKVEQCIYDPGSSSIRTRVTFNELSVSGVVSMSPFINREAVESIRRFDYPLTTESCRMSIRLRRAAIEFYTTPIAHSHGHMRIRTESSFLEPRFSSIYAFGCRPVIGTLRADPRIKRRHDKKRQQSRPRDTTVEPRILSADAQNNDDSQRDSNHLESPKLNSLEKSSTDDDLDDLLTSSDTISASNKIGTNALLTNLWQSRDSIAREMEDVFLQGASQALTHYIEKQLHPAIKETLMMSMGYTISYG